MKVLKPMAVGDIPLIERPRAQNEELYQRALSLNGLALPVEFETWEQARCFATTCKQVGSRGRRLGLDTAQRGKTVFLYRKREEA